MNENFFKIRETLSNKITIPTNRYLELPESNPIPIFVNPINKSEIII